MIIVDHIAKLAHPKEEGLEIVLAMAKYQKNNLGAKVEVIISDTGRLDEIILRKYFDSLSEWEAFKEKPSQDPESMKSREPLDNKAHWSVDGIRRKIWKKLEV